MSKSAMYPATDYVEELLAVGDLEIDIRVQREPNLKKIDYIYSHFSWDAIGVVTVSRRRDRSLVIIDGQSRVAAARRITDNQGKVRCHVFKGLSLEQEAQMFLDLNYTTKPSEMDKFGIRVTATDPVALEMARIASVYGWKFGRNKEIGTIQAVAHAERLYKRSLAIEAEPNLLQMMVLVASRAWGNDPAGVRGPVITGLGAFVEEYNALIDQDRLIDKLRTWQRGPEGLYTEAMQHHKAYRMRPGNAVADLVTSAYNQGLRNRLASWTKRT